MSGTVSATSSQVVTCSIFVKKKDHDYFYFGTGGASAFGAVVYQFSTNTFTVSGLSATATNYGNGWIRLTITGTTGATDLRLLFTPTMRLAYAHLTQTEPMALGFGEPKRNSAHIVQATSPTTGHRAASHARRMFVVVRVILQPLTIAKAFCMQR